MSDTREGYKVEYKSVYEVDGHRVNEFADETSLKVTGVRVLRGVVYFIGAAVYKELGGWLCTLRVIDLDTGCELYYRHYNEALGNTAIKSARKFVICGYESLLQSGLSCKEI